MALIQAMCGRADDVAATLEEIQRDAAHPSHLFDGFIWRARAWERWLSGDPEGARAAIAAGLADVVERGDVSQEAALLHDLARLGRPDEVTARLDEIAAEAHGALIPTLAGHARALVADDAGALGEVADAFEEMGILALAAEAAGSASEAAKRAQDQRLATRWRNRASQIRAHCDTVVGPVAAVAAADAATVVALTRREREISLLAAQGLASREIGERLFISRRTAESHLARVFTKLGVRSRAELARMLDGGVAALVPA